MTYKIDARATADGFRLEIQGQVDAAALAGIEAAVRERGRARLRVVLKEGCQVVPAILERLARLERVELIAESPFLARWLARI